MLAQVPITEELPAIRGWKPFALADKVWGSLAIGLVIKLHQKKFINCLKLASFASVIMGLK